MNRRNGSEAFGSGRHLEWAGLWTLDTKQVTWHRDRIRHAKGGDITESVTGPQIRTRKLIAVDDLQGHLAVVRSHPDTPGVLPAGFEGLWFEVSETDPLESVDMRVAVLGLEAVRESFVPILTATTTIDPETTPHLVSPVNESNSVYFDHDPLAINGITVYVRERAS